jgi:hypothetical protein
MSALDRIAHLQNRRDEVPNQELARELAAQKDHQGIREIAENLWNDDKNIQADCVKVLYEIGYIDPFLIAGYADDFLKLLRSRENRLVWGGRLRSPLCRIRADSSTPIWRNSQGNERRLGDYGQCRQGASIGAQGCHRGPSSASAGAPAHLPPEKAAALRKEPAGCGCRQQS